MKLKTRIISPFCSLWAFLLGGALLVSAGCSGAEYRAEELPPKAEIQKKIDVVTANTNIPDSAKPRIIEGLKRQMERAK